MAAANKISQQELIAKIQDIDISDEELAKYFIVDQDSSGAFSPQVIPNPDLIEDNGFEGAFVINTFNKLARSRRNRKYHESRTGMVCGLLLRVIRGSSTL